MTRWRLPASDTYFADRLTEEGFEIDHLLAALRHVKVWGVAVDGGAHIGTWSVEMARLFGWVHAFEPAADTFECLQQNTAGLLNVEAHRVALGANHGYAVVRDDRSRAGNTGARFVEQTGIGDVLVRTLDSYGLRDVGLIKLDLEGFEPFALAGARGTIERWKPIVLIEEKSGMAERFGLQLGDARRLLESWGARFIGGVRNDKIFSF